MRYLLLRGLVSFGRGGRVSALVSTSAGRERASGRKGKSHRDTLPSEVALSCLSVLSE